METEQLRKNEVRVRLSRDPAARCGTVSGVVISQGNFDLHLPSVYSRHTMRSHTTLTLLYHFSLSPQRSSLRDAPAPCSRPHSRRHLRSLPPRP